uniref:EF-hand domain-containing protein n=1 Tax=Macrostomum lignano TaxID=282301 RepID=A0A1I8FL64_9PLAT
GKRKARLMLCLALSGTVDRKAESHICLAIPGRRLQARGDRKAESHLSCDLRPEIASARRLQKQSHICLAISGRRLQARAEIAKQSHICLAISGRDCKRIAKAESHLLAISGRRLQAHGDRKQSHICLAISGRRLQARAEIAKPNTGPLRTPQRHGWNRLEKRLTLTEQRQNSGGEGGGGGNSSSSKEATSQAVSARPSLTQSIDPNRIPDEPWLENNWEINPEAYENLCRLYKQLEETVFRIVSDGEDRRPMSCILINLISECDRSGSGLLDVYDFRLLIAKLQQMEQLECTQAQPPMEREREKMDEALLEASDLQSWSWDIAIKQH